MSRVVMGMKTRMPLLRHHHTVQAIHFSREWDSEEAPVECSCSWEGTVRDWPEHAKGLSVQRPWSAIGPGKMETWQGPTHRVPDTRVIEL